MKSPYSPESAEGMQKGKGLWNWMENIYRHCVFSDAIDLWACYAHGYLSGRFTAGKTTGHTTIIRHEDLVAYPTKLEQHTRSGPWGNHSRSIHRPCRIATMGCSTDSAKNYRRWSVRVYPLFACDDEPQAYGLVLLWHWSVEGRSFHASSSSCPWARCTRKREWFC